MYRTFRELSRKDRNWEAMPIFKLKKKIVKNTIPYLVSEGIDGQGVGGVAHTCQMGLLACSIDRTQLRLIRFITQRETLYIIASFRIFFDSWNENTATTTKIPITGQNWNFYPWLSMRFIIINAKTCSTKNMFEKERFVLELFF